LVHSDAKEFPYFYKFKHTSGELYMPLSFNEDYHKFQSVVYDYTKEHYVTFKNNKLHIGLTTEREAVTYKENGLVIGLDINVRDNFISVSNGQIIDYDRTYIKELVDELLRIDKLSKTEKETDYNRRILNKLVKKNEWYFKWVISTILEEFDKQGVSDIVMEDLDLTKSKASFVKSEEFNIKYSRIVRVLRLSNIKDWFKRQAENYGIRVHLTNPAYTSQECSECHFIHRANRNGAEFECKECGHKEHSDSNSPKNILGRVYYSDVLMKKLHTYDADKRLIPRNMSNFQIKVILNDFFESELAI
jgi:putative transposase